MSRELRRGLWRLMPFLQEVSSFFTSFQGLLEGDYFGRLFLEVSNLGFAAFLHLKEVPPHAARRLDIGEELVPNLQGRIENYDKGRVTV